MVQEVIEDHLPANQLKVLKAAEESERSILAMWADSLVEGGR
jgi:hypothetical protein